MLLVLSIRRLVVSPCFKRARILLAVNARAERGLSPERQTSYPFNESAGARLYSSLAEHIFDITPGAVSWACIAIGISSRGISSRTSDLISHISAPFFAERGRGLIRILTDRGNDYCGKQETHDYRLSLAVKDIEHATAPRFPGATRYNIFISYLAKDEVIANIVHRMRALSVAGEIKQQARSPGR